MKAPRNPLAFTPLPVTIFSTVVYAAVIIVLLVIHLVVPAAPSTDVPVKGVNLTEAWLDLQTLSNGFHPYNSRRNDEVRDWLLRRLEAIVQHNNASTASLDAKDDAASAQVVIFNDMTSNLTFSTALLGSPGLSTYFEGTNIIVYVRGSKDEPGAWWTEPAARGDGVLVNAHYDSVSTGLGATDDGIGVITVLQLIRYFTACGNTPEKGIIALLNNGEEDYLHGAHAFAEHPSSRFPRRFLNLEGAGAGGRATLFRSTDADTTLFYRQAKHPFGTSLSDDGFKRGLVRSETDYVVFNGDLGMRGLDVAFMEPRSRYHTDQDDTKHTSMDSLWHMLSAALSTMQGMTASEGPRTPSPSTSDAVFFDLFGTVFVVFEQHTLFALSVALLVLGPISLIVTIVVLSQKDKSYLFSRSKQLPNLRIAVNGWRGAFRTPIILTVASCSTIGLAFLVTKVNPFIVYSSPFAVWSCFMSIWIFLAWFLSRVADSVRPSALHRTYSLLWLFLLAWVLLVASTVLVNEHNIVSGYPILFCCCGLWLATMTAVLEQFGLQSKKALVGNGGDVDDTEDQADPGRHRDLDDDEETTETTSLLRDTNRTSFAHHVFPRSAEEHDEEGMVNDATVHHVYGNEQLWSGSLPSYLWFLQLLLVAFPAIVFLGQIGLYATSALSQTLGDGNNPLSLYLLIAALTVLIMAPLTPFLHRYTYHVPTFLLFVFIGTLAYNLLAFPFSADNRLKIYFVQDVDLDTGLNTVMLRSIGAPFMDEVIASLPSAAGQKPVISKSTVPGTFEYRWSGLVPRVVPPSPSAIPPEYDYADWAHFNATRTLGKNEANFTLYGRNTRACKIVFSAPIADFHVQGAADDERFAKVPERGSREIRLWSRTWEKAWHVRVRWDNGEGKTEGEEGRDGKVVCLWNDENKAGTIPALDEVRRFAPAWTAVTKNGHGLVEGWKRFSV